MTYECMYCHKTGSHEDVNRSICSHCNTAKSFRIRTISPKANSFRRPVDFEECNGVVTPWKHFSYNGRRF